MEEIHYPESTNLPFMILHEGGNENHRIKRRIEIGRWLRDPDNGCAGAFGVVNTNYGFEYRFSHESSLLIFMLKYETAVP